MRPVLVDKIASVALRCGLRQEVRVGDGYPCRAGDLIAVRLTTSKSTYNQLELTTGRMSSLKQGDVIVGALGHRNALQGYEGNVPSTLKTGDTLNLLNMGGVLGKCESFSPLVGPPHACEVLGQVLKFPDFQSRIGVPANILDYSLPLTQEGSKFAPVIGVVGTSMNSGKTEACLTLVQQLVRLGLRVAAGKATGVSLRRDILGMEDSGAEKTSIFTDFGVVTTSPETAPDVTFSILTTLQSMNPDVIILELGDGILGDYGVQEILGDPRVGEAMVSYVVAASDPVGAWGAVSLLQDRYRITPDVITGPATDNKVGNRVIERSTGIHCLNARQSGPELAQFIYERSLNAKKEHSNHCARR